MEQTKKELFVALMLEILEEKEAPPEPPKEEEKTDENGYRMIGIQKAADKFNVSYSFIKKLIDTSRVRWVYTGRKYLIWEQSIIDCFSEEMDKNAKPKEDDSNIGRIRRVV